MRSKQEPGGADEQRGNPPQFESVAVLDLKAFVLRIEKRPSRVWKAVLHQHQGA